MTMNEDARQDNPEGLSESDVEQCIIGCMILFDFAVDYALSELTPEDFVSSANAEMFKVIRLLSDEGTAVDIMTILDKLQTTGRLVTVGGAQGIKQFMDIVPHGAHIRYYCRICKNNSLRRRLRDIAPELDTRAKNNDVSETIAWLESQLLDLSGLRSEGLKSMSDAVQEMLKRKGEPAKPVLTGFKELDQAVTMAPGQFNILGARPSMGKSAIVGQILDHVADTVGHCLFVSLEMDGAEYAERIVGKQHQHIARVSELPIMISDSEYDFDKICGMIRMAARRNRVKLVVIDYLQLIQMPHSRLSTEERIGHMSSTLKRLARQLRVPILAIVQLNRELEKRDDKRPKLSDIRGSGSIEQDADIVMFLHREVVYNPDADPGAAEVIIAKQRSGRRGTVVKLGWHGDETRFSDWSHRPVDVEGLFTENSFGEGVDV